MFEQTCGRTTCLNAHDLARAGDVMLREANHRIANSLQAVMAASMTVHAGSCGETAALRERLSTRISAIATLHRMLSISGVPGAIAFGEYLEELVENLSALWDGPRAVRITVHHAADLVDADVAVRIGMIVNELVTNSCKYAYADSCGGEIRVGFSVSDGRFILIVADDGKGFCQETMRLGMGTRLIAEFAKRLGAAFAYQPGRPGTIAVLSGPAEILLPRSGNTCGTSRARVEAKDQIIDVVAAERS